MDILVPRLMRAFRLILGDETIRDTRSHRDWIGPGRPGVEILFFRTARPGQDEKGDGDCKKILFHLQGFLETVLKMWSILCKIEKKMQEFKGYL